MRTRGYHQIALHEMLQKNEGARDSGPGLMAGSEGGKIHGEHFRALAQWDQVLPLASNSQLRAAQFLSFYYVHQYVTYCSYTLYIVLTILIFWLLLHNTTYVFYILFEFARGCGQMAKPRRAGQIRWGNDKYALDIGQAMKLGMKMRYNEAFRIQDFSPQSIELHLADGDLELHRGDILDNLSTIPEVPIIVHAPMNHFLKQDRRPLVDLSASSEKLRLMSLDVIRSAMDLVGELDADYLVLHPGGQVPDQLPNQLPDQSLPSSPPSPISIPARPYHRNSNQDDGEISAHPESPPPSTFHTRSKLMSERKSFFMKNLLGSLHTLEQDFETKEMLMENMPWHYWMWGNTELWHSPILQTPDEYAPVLDYTHVCLDICHAYLAEPEGSNANIHNFLETLGTRIKHVHISDAIAPDGEGVQLGDGEIELRKVFRRLLDLDVSVIPEIRDGHLNGRKGMYESIGRFNSIVLGRSIVR
jgi:sugar phosphate isomerase/epimerase